MSDLDQLRSSATGFDFDDDDDLGSAFDGDNVLDDGSADAAPAMRPIERFVLAFFVLLNTIALVFIVLIATGRVG